MKPRVLSSLSKYTRISPDSFFNGGVKKRVRNSYSLVFFFCIAPAELCSNHHHLVSSFSFYNPTTNNQKHKIYIFIDRV